MPRRPAKAAPVEQPSTLSRIAKLASDWRAILALFVMLCSGVAFALSLKFATKAELVPLQEHVAKHDQDVAGINQSLQDIKEGQDRMLQWLFEMRQHER